MDLTSRQLLRRRRLLRRRDYDGDEPDIRRNPMRFDLRYSKEVAAERSRESRAVRSMVSPTLQRKNVKRMANSPHTFIVVVAPDYEDDVVGTPGAVTLGVSISNVRDAEQYGEKRGRYMRESLYTAFTYLHRFGDKFVDDFVGWDDGYSLLDPEARPDDPIYASFYQMVDEHLAWLEQEGGESYPVPTYLHMIGLSVNSKMVREGYADGWDQAFADLFPLCELTPPTRPLLLPVTVRKIPPRIVGVFNDYIVPDFNASFRAFYNLLIPHLYGSVEWL